MKMRGGQEDSLGTTAQRFSGSYVNSKADTPPFYADVRGCKPSQQQRGDVGVIRRTGVCGALARTSLTEVGLMSEMFEGGLIVLLKLWIAFIWRALPRDDCLIWDIGNVG